MKKGGKGYRGEEEREREAHPKVRQRQTETGRLTSVLSDKRTNGQRQIERHR